MRVCEQPLCVRNSHCYHRCYRHRRAACHKGPFLVVRLFACARACKRERERCLYECMYIRIRKLWRHLRPSDQSENALRERFAHCSADVCNTKASWCDGPECSIIRLTVQFFTFIFRSFLRKSNYNSWLIYYLFFSSTMILLKPCSFVVQFLIIF